MIYVLLLQKDKIYVGYSAKPIGERFLQHFNYNGSKWTTKYRPLQVLQVKPGGPEQENEMTLKMMDHYGWWNVRGGSWCKVEMNECPPALLEYQNLKLPKPLGKSSGQSSKKSTVSGCTRCGRKSHKIQNCYAKTSLDGSCLEPLGDSQSCTDDDASSSSDEDVDNCFRCGRPGHFRSACYAKTDINGYFL